jgi:hypothetical protein
LHEIVGAEAQKIGLAGEEIGHDGRAGDLDHDAERDDGCVLLPAGSDFAERDADQAPDLFELA